MSVIKAGTMKGDKDSDDLVQEKKGISDQLPLTIATTLKWIAFIAFLFYGVAFLEHSFRHAFYNWSSDYVEMPELGRAIALSQGESIYTSWDSAPFHEANYTPIYTFCNAIFVALLGPSLLWGRLISLACVITTTLLMGKILVLLKVPRFYAVLSGLLYCSGHIIWMWGSLVRVDNLAVLFQIAALWVYLSRYHEKKEPKALIWCAVLLIAAAFTRQTMVAAAIAIIASLFATDRKTALRFTAMYALMGLTGLALLMGLTSGLAWKHLISANVNEFGMDELWFFAVHFWNLYHWLLPFCLIGLLALRNTIVLTVYFMAALCVSTTVGKIGASLNYLIEFWAAMCMLSTVGLWRLNESKRFFQYKWIPALSWLVVMVGWQQLFHFPYHQTTNSNGKIVQEPLPHYKPIVEMNKWLPFHYLDPIGSSPSEIHTRVFKEYLYSRGTFMQKKMAAIESELRSIDGPILSEDMNFTLSLGKEIWIQPFEFTQMDRQGLWSSSEWIQAVERQEFGALVLMFDLKIDIPSPVDATILSAPEERRFHFEKDSALFQIQAGDQIGPVIIPIAGEMLEIKARLGQNVKKGESLAIVAPQISHLATQRFPQEVLLAMREKYMLHKRIGTYRIYIPQH